MTDGIAPGVGIYAAFIVGTLLLAAVLTVGAAIFGTIVFILGALFSSKGNAAIIAFIRRRSAAAKRTLVVQLAAGAGVVFGALIGLGLMAILSLPWPWWQAASSGALCGLVSGGLLGVVAARVLGIVTARVMTRVSGLGGRIIDQ